MPFSTYLYSNANPQKRAFGVIAGVALAVGTGTPAFALTQDVIDLMGRCAPGVHPTTLGAVVRHESSGNPYAIGVNGGAKLIRQPRTREEAIATAAMLQRQGINFDSGLGQVNVRNVSWLGVSVADLFDPCVNLRSAATVLTDCYSRSTKAGRVGQAAIHAALSCYNTGSLTRGLANGYVAKVSAKAGAVTLPRPSQAKPPFQVASTGEPTHISSAKNGDAFGEPQADAFAVGVR